MSDRFQVTTIHAESGRVETVGYDIVPALPQGQVVCNLFAEFLAARPAEFREKLPFLNKVDVDLQWAAASGGAAFMALIAGAEPLAMGILLSGADSSADEQMIDALRTSVLGPMLGEDSLALADVPGRPAAVLLQLPGSPEHTPLVQLLTTALASVYFRAVEKMAAAES